MKFSFFVSCFLQKLITNILIIKLIYNNYKIHIMPCIKKQSVSLSCGHTVCVPQTVIKYITNDTECSLCIKTKTATIYGKNKSV